MEIQVGRVRLSKMMKQLQLLKGHWSHSSCTRVFQIGFSDRFSVTCCDCGVHGRSGRYHCGSAT
ncbi:hypothetical protein HanXRQr2_Chr14g0639741 [Helianthus annuus]|uniref:Uncharacterized protein n=1 Tax=Helianthus annuus TaxID=4232 RepID=A0A9K3H853_HELAN|nr:hypothetical protein HanXRQr2_Chr14g0639741 [Helianthus annuus]KAJ0468224.1 hypothetical protein HanIR_Chr14g0694191 [Helianthus annuus]KAJ0485405.1 hypothetical protein HanHA89_Chr14g0567941 [Helianthus annuus]KAJ0655955.1 hypothetical protein HanLR1_Chr14g0530291 [Helianthus annuus]KAJ0659630.1 hypothetical protein HanOQP8_Chr14g0528361 [Helianthus annuus]